MGQYNEDIDKTIIDILQKKGERTFGKLKDDIEKSIKRTLSFETFSYRLNAMIKPNEKDSKYTICPVLNKRDEGRGKKVFYSLIRDARIRCELNLPIMKTETVIEKAYRLLFYYFVFGYNHSKQLKNEDKYNELLEKLNINKNELEILENSFKDFKITKWIHPESEIDFIRKEYLKSSGKEGRYEYSYMLPGISPLEFEKIRIIGLTYQQLDYTKDEVLQYFGLLEEQKLIKRIKLKEFEYLDEERYTIVDNSLRELLADCWNLQSHVSTYLEYLWESISKPTNKEKIWFEHLWGKNRTNKWFRYCHNKRKEYQKKNKNQILKETQDRINWEKSEIRKIFNLINEKYSNTIKDYSYFINPLLNVAYPEFLRKEFSQNN